MLFIRGRYKRLFYFHSLFNWFKLFTAFNAKIFLLFHVWTTFFLISQKPNFVLLNCKISLKIRTQKFRKCNLKWETHFSFYWCGSYWTDPFLLDRQCVKKQSHHSADKGLSGQGYGLSSIHVWMWELDRKEGRALKNGWLSTVVLEKTWESPEKQGDQTCQS